MTAVNVIDRFSRLAPLGLALRDVATGQPLANAFDVVASPPGGRAVRLSRNGRQVWIASRLPGLRDSDLDPAAGSAAPRRYDLAVDDPAGAFLPLRLDLTLPHHGLYEWDGWAALPQAPLAPLRDTPAGPACAGSLPLFSAPARTAPAGTAEIRGQLRRADDGANVAWALLTASVDGEVLGLGLADAQGRFALFMPWPQWPRASLPALSPPPGSPPAVSPPQPPVAGPSWMVTVEAYSAYLPAERVPSLPDIMGQLASPRTLYASTASPLEPLAPQRLQFGSPLFLRTERAPDRPSSFLIMAAA